MKKIISVLMVAVCLMMAAPAQAQLHFGVKGGLNISKVEFFERMLLKGIIRLVFLWVRWLNSPCLLSG